MGHNILSSRKMQKMMSASCLVMMLVWPLQSVMVQAKPAAEPAKASNKEVEALKERLGQLEQRFINMQSRLGTIESMASRGGATITNETAPSYQTQNNGSSGDNNAGNGVGSMRGAGSADGDRAVNNGGGAETGGANAQGGVPVPAPSGSKPRRIESDEEFRPFGDQSSREPNPAEKQNQLASGNGDNRRVDVRKRTVALQAPSGLDSSTPAKLYQASYRMLLKPNYNEAEKGFSYFLQQFPRDKRASNAQYWLGESYFVQKKYKLAAGSYLKGYKKYPNSVKAPDSFLKLAVSLGKLGQKQASCATFKAFPVKYPNATSYVKRRFEVMKSRAGC